MVKYQITNHPRHNLTHPHATLVPQNKGKTPKTKVA